MKAAWRKYYQEHKEQAKEYHKKHYKEKAEYLRNLRLNRKNQVFDYYGRKCNCCSEIEPFFLTIDHINNDGYLERNTHEGGSSDRIIRNIIKNNFPGTYQILCMNCNFGKSRNGGICPHKVA